MDDDIWAALRDELLTVQVLAGDLHLPAVCAKLPGYGHSLILEAKDDGVAYAVKFGGVGAGVGLSHPVDCPFEEGRTYNLIEHDDGNNHGGKAGAPLGKLDGHLFGQPQPNAGLGNIGHPADLVIFQWVAGQYSSTEGANEDPCQANHK